MPCTGGGCTSTSSVELLSGKARNALQGGARSGGGQGVAQTHPASGATPRTLHTPPTKKEGGRGRATAPPRGRTWAQGGAVE